MISDLSDYHTAAVGWGLTQVGVPFIQWEGLGYEPERQATFDLAISAIHLGGHLVSPEDVIWFRRPRHYSFHPKMHELDRPFARSEAFRFTENLGFAFETIGCRCINSPSAAWAINRKAAQLVLARNSGFNVPNTIMGNQSAAIFDYIDKPNRRAIYKGFLPHVWLNQSTGHKAFSETVAMPRTELCDSDQLSYLPGIYQDRIEKNSDIRVVVMRDSIRAFMLHCEALDWRLAAACHQARLEEVTIPSSTRSSIRSFMKEAQLVLGSFDFAVAPDGSWWFLEINEAGQFLWIDQMLPEAGLFQDFLAFVSGLPKTDFPCLSDFVFDRSKIPERPMERSALLTIEG